MKFLKPGGTFYGILTTHSLDTGAAAAPDATPTAVAIKNGAIDAGFVLTVNATPVATGIYAVSGTVPATYSAGDEVIGMGTYAMGGITRNEKLECGEFTVVGEAAYDEIINATAVTELLSLTDEVP